MGFLLAVALGVPAAFCGFIQNQQAFDKTIM
jgi:hypothetical protein